MLTAKTVSKKEFSSNAINKATEFISRNILPWGEIPTFNMEDGIEKNYIYMPLATGYYLDSFKNLQKENPQHLDFIKRSIKSKDQTYQKNSFHPEIDTIIKFQYLCYNDSINRHQQFYWEDDPNELESEVSFIDDIAIYLNYIQLISVFNKEKFDKNISRIQPDSFIRNRSLFYNSKYFHFYQLSKICSENSIQLMNLGFNQNHIKSQNLESLLDMVFHLYFQMEIQSSMKNIDENVNKILHLQNSDGSWPAESFFINYIGSKVLTSIFCVELLKKYTEWI